MVERGEILFSKGDSLATVRDPDEPNDILPIPPVILPIRLYLQSTRKDIYVCRISCKYQ